MPIVERTNGRRVDYGNARSTAVARQSSPNNEEGAQHERQVRHSWHIVWVEAPAPGACRLLQGWSRWGAALYMWISTCSQARVGLDSRSASQVYGDVLIPFTCTRGQAEKGFGRGGRGGDAGVLTSQCRLMIGWRA